MANQIHVVPHNNDGWNVKRDDAQRASGHFATKGEAVTRARELARKDKLELVVHNKDGKIGQKDSFGNDPRASKG